jgi:uncharacterized membrane protein YdjX (TVP38/TMEM64 family)
VYLVARATGLLERVDSVEEVRALTVAAGPWGQVAFIAGFALGELVHVPGFLFVAAAALAYGKAAGFALSFIGAVLSVSLSFAVVRRLGGTALADLDRPWIRRVLGHLDRRPVRTVVALRLVLWLAPGLNYALALTRVRFRDYLVGSALGLALPVLGITLFFEYLLGAAR